MAENWIALHEHFNGGIKCSRGEDDRKFKSFAGVAPEVAEFVYLKYLINDKFERWHLLLVLYFLKHNPSEDEGASRFLIASRNTYRKKLWDTIYHLDFFMDEITIDSRFDDYVPDRGIFKNIALVVDGTDCPIDRPNTKDERLAFSSGRNKENTYGKYNIKYTVAVQISSGRICAILGPEPGSVADITALRNGELIAVITSKDPLEIVLADKGYQGMNNCLSPIKGKDLSPIDDAFNEVIASVRQIVECVLHRIKIFGVLGNDGRFHCKIEKHRPVFNLCCQFTNISMTRDPVYQYVNWYLLNDFS